jgi:hypothetical protein
MLALLASMLISLPATPSASVSCPDWPASCDGAWVLRTAGTDDGPRDYATPAEVECPTVALGPMLSDECDQAPPDLWYRVSRFPDGGPAGTLAAARRPTGDRVASSCGTPPSAPTRAVTPDAQPIALVAVPVFVATGDAVDLPTDAQAPAGRALVPPDRPPRG